MSRLKPYYPVFKFVLVFGVLYTVLSLTYYGYLQLEYQESNYPDPVTAAVSRQTQNLLQFAGYNAQIVNAPSNPSIILYIDDQLVFRVIEGCNAVSVMLLFIAFVVAFAKAWKETIFFIGLGLFIINSVNLARLVVLAIIYKEWVPFKEIAHDFAFPAVMYGTVILLWIYWIKKLETA